MKKAIQVMISSPSDVMQECEIIKKTLENFSHEISTYDFIANSWKNSAPIDSRKSAQQQINNTVLEDADIVIAIFGLKLGSPTENYESGTIEEIERHLAKGKFTCIYFIKRDISSLDMTPKMLEDIKKIMDFKAKIQKTRFFAQIDDLEELKSRVRKDLQYYVNNLKEEESKKVTEQTSVTNNFDPLTTKQDYKSDLGIYSELFITDIINEEIKRENIKGEYKGNLTFYENIQLLKDKDQIYTESSFIEVMQRARRIAFNKKYSDYDYNKNDARTLCDWKTIIKSKLETLLNGRLNKSVLGIGSNDGSELLDIFGDQENKYTVVDISDMAIKKGESKFPQISFKQGDMESLNRLVDKESFDICLCLRSIQSRGVFRNNAIIQMMKTLKKGGVLMISIPNGYLDKDKKFAKGLYDYRIKSIVKDRPITLVQKIYKKLTDLNFNNVGVQSIDSEILVWGIK